jgi:hypothetical protein
MRRGRRWWGSGGRRSCGLEWGQGFVRGWRELYVGVGTDACNLGCCTLSE